MRNKNYVKEGFGASFNPRDFKKFNPKYILDRATPLELIFIIAIIFLIIGGIAAALRFFLWIGLLIIAVYIIYLILWFIVRSAK